MPNVMLSTPMAVRLGETMYLRPASCVARPTPDAERMGPI